MLWVVSRGVVSAVPIAGEIVGGGHAARMARSGDFHQTVTTHRQIILAYGVSLNNAVLLTTRWSCGNRSAIPHWRRVPLLSDEHSPCRLNNDEEPKNFQLLRACVGVWGHERGMIDLLSPTGDWREEAWMRTRRGI